MNGLGYDAIGCLVVILFGVLSAGLASGDVSSDFGGHLRLQGQLSDLDQSRYADGILELRLKESVYAGQNHSLNIDYEAVGASGGLREALNEPAAFSLGDAGGRNPLLPAAITDERRLMDLATTLHETDNSIVYHRIDRLVWQWRPDWGALDIGRQAVTWGNGRLFNPMDLFNPFSPVDFNRDYKIGDDMIRLTVPADIIGEVEALQVIRRDPTTGDVTWDESSSAFKAHLFRGTAEFDLMAAMHYNQPLIGFGSRGYIRDAAWWCDIVWQAAEETDAYLSGVAGLDYAWTRWGKNFYGQVEAFYSGIGHSDAVSALTDPAVIERLDRGELYTLGTWYADAMMQVELHPLVNLYLTALVSMTDGSGLLQPRMVWNTSQNTNLIFGGSHFFGPQDSEFGGFEIPGTPVEIEPADTLFVWGTWYF